MLDAGFQINGYFASLDIGMPCLNGADLIR